MSDQKFGNWNVLEKTSEQEYVVSKADGVKRSLRLIESSQNQDGQVILFSHFSNPHFLSIEQKMEEDHLFVLEDIFEGAKPLSEVDLEEREVITLAKSLFDLFDALPEGLFHGHLSPHCIYCKDGLFKIGGFGQGLTQKPIQLSAEFFRSFEDFSSIAAATKDPKLQQLQSQFFCLSPEQLFHSTATVKSDFYAIGVILYYALTKQFPVVGYTKVAKLKPAYEKNWDRLIDALLVVSREDRVHSLMPLLDDLLAGAVLKPLEDVKSTLEETFKRSKQIAESKSKNSPSPFASNYQPPKMNEMTATPKVVDPSKFMQTEMTVSAYKPQSTQLVQSKPIATKTVVIPAGSYFRGSKHGPRDEMPRHQIKIDSFAIEIHPVTNDQFIPFLEHLAGVKDDNNNDVIRLKDSRIKLLRGQFSVETGYGQHPITGVSWYGAAAYAKWIGGRLPTEAEWEVAANGTDSDRLYPTGKSISKNQANFFYSDTTKVMSYPANSVGLYDMAGNVYEWCSDWYDFHYYDTSENEPINPTGPVQGVYRTLRGGCWKSLQDDLRCAHRHRNNPGSFNTTYGFRVAFDGK